MLGWISKPGVRSGGFGIRPSSTMVVFYLPLLSTVVLYIFRGFERFKATMTKKHAEKKQPETAAAAESSDAPSAEASPPLQTVSEDLDKLKAQAAKAAEHWEKLLRTTADFENFKKRAARERQEAAAYANAALLQKIIPVLDNFEIALAATASAADPATQSMQAGVKMIASQLRAALADAGLEEIDATGKAFDPNFHEAVSQQDSSDVPEGHVLQQLRKGYKLRDRLLRPATVVVAKKPSLTAEATGPA